MSQEDVEVVRSLYDALDSWDIDAVVALVADDMVAELAPGVPWSGVYHGPDGLRRLLETIDEYVQLTIETDTLIDAGDFVAQMGRSTGTARLTGVRFAFNEIHHWRVRDGKIVSFRNYSDIAEQRRVLAADIEA